VSCRTPSSDVAGPPIAIARPPQRGQPLGVLLQRDLDDGVRGHGEVSARRGCGPTSSVSYGAPRCANLGWTDLDCRRIILYIQQPRRSAKGEGTIWGWGYVQDGPDCEGVRTFPEVVLSRRVRKVPFGMFHAGFPITYREIDARI
jgi:hypothetical protein